MYKYTKMINDGRVDFLNKYEFSKKNDNYEDFYDYDELELFLNFITKSNYYIDEDFICNLKNKYKDKNNRISLNNLVENYVSFNCDKLFGEVDMINDIENDNLSFVKSFLIELDIFCSLYDNCEIDSYKLRKLIQKRFNYLLFLKDIYRYEGLDYIDDGDRKRIDLAYNYLFSNLYSIAIINHDSDKKFRNMIYSGNNNYKNICFNNNIDMDNVNFEDEFNHFVNNYGVENVLKLKKNKNKILKKY